MKKKKTKKKKNYLLVWKENFVKNTPSSFHFHFLSNLERSSFGGLGKKTAEPHYVSLPLPSQPNTLIFTFLIFVFHPPYSTSNHPPYSTSNQMDPK